MLECEHNLTGQETRVADGKCLIVLRVPSLTVPLSRLATMQGSKMISVLISYVLLTDYLVGFNGPLA